MELRRWGYCGQEDDGDKGRRIEPNKKQYNGMEQPALGVNGIYRSRSRFDSWEENRFNNILDLFGWHKLLSEKKQLNSIESTSTQMSIGNRENLVMKLKHVLFFIRNH